VAIQGGRTKTQETVPDTFFFPPTDNPTPQETTNQDASEMEKDGGDYSCPGSSVVVGDIVGRRDFKLGTDTEIIEDYVRKCNESEDVTE
jgi:hypothetical protein